MVKPTQGISILRDLTEYVALAVVDADKYQQTNISIVKELLQQGIPGVYVTLNKPYPTLRKQFEKEKIDTRKIIFIDAVTKTISKKAEKKEECLFIGNPENLSDISIAMDQAIMAIPKKEKFLFFDSLSTLLLYNNVNVVAKFIHFIAAKMRQWKVRGIIISLRRKQDQDLIMQLKAFCDVTLEL